jgi:hypothetical protein
VVGPVLVTVEAPNTAKLCAIPKNGVADAGAAPQNTAITANASVDNDFSALAVRVLLADLDAIFMLGSLWGVKNDQVRRTIVDTFARANASFMPNEYFAYLSITYARLFLISDQQCKES